jgi:hypothetical protein
MAAASDTRAPIASTCPADPFTGDGSACPGGAIGTSLFAFTNTPAGPQALFAQGYAPDGATTGAASAATETTATVAGAVATDGARTFVHFDYGTTVAYGASTASQLVGPASGVSTPVSAALAALPAGKVIHYRVVAQTDFGTVFGSDATFKTVGKPSESQGSLSGIARRKAVLAFTVKAGTNAPSIKTISVSLPSGLSFAHNSTTLTKGIALTSASGRHLKFRVRLSHGTLVITLKSAATFVHVTVGRSAIAVTGRLANAVKHHNVKRLTIGLKVIDAHGKTTRFSLKLKVK